MRIKGNTMIRRSFGKIMATLGTRVATGAVAAEETLPAAELETELGKEFAYPIVEVSGANALEEWERLRAAGDGTPVVFGGRYAKREVMERFGNDNPVDLAQFDSQLMRY